MIVFGGRGGRGNEGQSQIDGLGTGAAINGGGVSGYGQLETAQEVVMTTAGGLGEAEVGGPIINFIPQDRRQHLPEPLLRLGHEAAGCRADNYTPELKTAGMRHAAEDAVSVGHQPVDGGPIKKDRLWFFYNTRYPRQRAARSPACTTTRTPATPTKWLYEPDFSRRPRTATRRARSSRRCA